MPVYEYMCQDCGRRFSRFFWRIADADGTRCRCGSVNLEQLISRVAMPRSEESRLESMADPAAWGDLDESDPKSMARMMRKMGSELGEDLGPEFNEVVDRLEAGEDPESIDSSLDPSGAGADTDNLF
ncbi:zinc ribbon domain-containing protein [Acidobacteria bacterium AH-259-D05]|nr:zinc ribbon domain-containing protein [Acidobacteria bacterium AH-259-D05]